MAERQSEKQGEAEDTVSESDSVESSPETPDAEENEESIVETSPSRDSQEALEAEISLPSASILDSNLLANVRVNWETVAWAAIFIVAVVSRFYALGVRGMSHDESLHAVYSYDLYRTGSYQHNPMMHGPLLFHTNAFIYFLFGVNDATARIMPALAGIGTVVAAWFYRRWLGRTGALLAGLLLLLSPSLLFYSRYIRNDIYIILLSMMWIYGMFRFVEERKMKWLYLTVTTMALGFATKENQFMSGAIFGVFMAGAAVWRWWAGRESWRDSPFADLAVLLFTLVLPFVAPIGHLVLGWEPLAYSSTQDLARSAILVLLMTVLSAAIAYWWFSPAHAKSEASKTNEGENPARKITYATWATLMGLFWAIEIVLFTTFFTNPVDGMATGVVGSLGYWLEQHGVNRGGQPWYYYIMQGLLYEFLLMILSLGGWALVVRRLLMGYWDVGPVDEDSSAKSKKRGGKKGRQAGADSSSATLQAKPYVILFLAWWSVAAWLAYSIAGEKMPWLLTHIAHPMALIGGWWGGQILQRLDWKEVRERQGWWLLGLPPALLFVLGALFGSIPTGGREVDTLARTVRFLLALGIGGGLLYFTYLAFLRSGWRLTLRLAAVTVFAILLLLTVRFSYLLSFINYDMATEYLVYAHAAPDVKRALQEIETISERTVGEREIQVSYDDDVAWPMTWYMRFYPNHIFYGANPTTEAMSAPIILVGKKNYDKVQPYVARDYVSRNYRLVWWPEESYKGEVDEEGFRKLTFTQIMGALTEQGRRDRLWQIFFFRNHPDRTLTAWPHRHDFRMYVKKEIADIIWDLNVIPLADTGTSQAHSFDYEEIDRNANLVYSGIYGNLPLVTPRTIAVGPDGLRYVLDTGNNRVVVLNPEGWMQQEFGSTCFLAEGESGGCVDPDGGGALELGDGQFREPWGIAVGADGTVYVADTWNGRIQAFDKEGNFLRKWGMFSIISEENRDPYALFGPRGLAVSPSGNVLVADTGNKRILEFTAEGEFVRQVGGPGILLGRFEEPVDVTIHPPTGNVLVTDAWNRRIQVLSAELAPLFEWYIPTWESQDIWDKPFIAAAANGMVYATDPEFAQVYVISSGGIVQSSFGRYGVELNRFAKPTGIAVDPLTGELLVADADNNRILVFGGN